MERLSYHDDWYGNIVVANHLLDAENNQTLNNKNVYVVTHIYIYDISVVKLYFTTLNTKGLDALYYALDISKKINIECSKYINSIIHETLIEYSLKYSYVSNIYKQTNIVLEQIRSYLEDDIENINDQYRILLPHRKLTSNDDIKNLNVIHKYIHGFIDILYKSINSDLNPSYNISEFDSYADPTGKFLLHDIVFNSSTPHMVVKKYIGVIPYV